MTTTTKRAVRRKNAPGSTTEVNDTDAVNEASGSLALLANLGTAETAMPGEPLTKQAVEAVKKAVRKPAPVAKIAAQNAEKDGEKNGEKTKERTPAERYTVTIHEMPSNERPRERLVHFGASALSTTELLAIQLRIGTRERSAVGLAELLLSHFEGLRGVAGASVEELKHVKGIGEVKAIEIIAAVELGKRLAALTPEEKPCIRSPQDVANLLMPEMRDLKKEHLKSLLLDSKNRVMKVMTVSVGILDSSLVHPREVFKDAILASSASLIIAHNHPSGDPTPSPEDKRITQRLHEAGQLLGIDLLDHIVIGDQRWVSLKERGVI